MGSTAAAAVLVLAATGPLAGQIFPGDAAQPPAFPTALSVWALVSLGGQRATRSWVDISDPDCMTTPCASDVRIAGSLGVGARFQSVLGPRVGIRLGASYSRPRQKVLRTQPTHQTNIGDPLSVIRGEALLLFRLKRRVPVFFGAGLAMASFTPGPVPGQDAAIEVGTAFAVGFDRQVTPRIGTRAEWTMYVLRPSTDLPSAEFRAAGLAFDHHVSFGVNFYLNP